ncbi:MAG: DUF2254 domain-containing protein [Actinobacteria bacterium]|nr:DUF2254 domain-containing protein [Actinomycetota bacterium]
MFQPFWVVPALWCVGALLAGIVLPEVDEALAEYVPLLFQAGTDGARTFLSAIAGAMISITGLVFSITIVVLQLASSQFSPRVLRTYLNQRVPQFTLGVFAASFIYALTVLRAVSASSSAGQASVPQIAVTVSFLLVLASVGMFLAFIHHITQSISVDTIINTVGKEVMGLLKRSDASRTSSQTQDPGPLPSMGLPTVVGTASSGYLTNLNHSALVALGAEHDVRIEVLYPLGTYLVQGTPVVTVHGGGDHTGTDWSGAVHGKVDVSWRRTTEQDPTFGLRQLVDIAERALSPGVNDPTTAVQVLNELHIVLTSIAKNDDVYPVHQDENDVVRLVTSEWSFEQYLSLCIDEIAHWGVSGLQIPCRIDEILSDLAVGATEPHRKTIEAKRVEVAQRVRGSS